MRFGVNYIPPKNWLHNWINFDESAVREDLETIKSIGLDHIRAHLIWPYFQINPTVMSSATMKNLERFTKICEETGIDFFLTLFTGWMSGFHFIPSFMNSHNRFSMFSGKEERECQRFYIRNIGSVVAKSPNFLGFDLGNELSCVTPLDANATIEINDDWQKEMLTVCEDCAPGKLHNNGVDHQPWFADRAFSREALVSEGAITPLHTWVKFTGAMNHGGVLSVSSLHIAEYMAELAKAYHTDPERKIWIQEFGCSKLWIENEGESIEEFVKGSFRVICETDNIWGFTWWCSHDLSPEFSGYDPLEYDLGLIDVNNQLKPAAKVLSELIAEYKRNPIVPIKRNEAIVYRPAAPDEDAWLPAKKFMTMIEKGHRPAIILDKYKNNKAYLESRGIDTVIE